MPMSSNEEIETNEDPYIPPHPPFFIYNSLRSRGTLKQSMHAWDKEFLRLSLSFFRVLSGSGLGVFWPDGIGSGGVGKLWKYHIFILEISWERADRDSISRSI